jgi:hypothetical protein
MSDDEVYSPALVPSEQIEAMPYEDSEPLEKPKKSRRERTEKQKVAFEKVRLKRLSNLRKKKEYAESEKVAKANKRSTSKKVKKEIIFVSEDESSVSEDESPRIVYKKKPKTVKTSTRKKKKPIIYESDSTESETQSSSDDEFIRQQPKRTRKRRPTFYDESDFGIKFVSHED